MKHKFFSTAKSVLIASALIIPLVSSAESYSFSVTRNSAAAVTGNCDYQRGAALSHNCDYVITVNQYGTVEGVRPTFKLIKISDGSVSTYSPPVGPLLGGSWGGSDFAIANDDNGVIVYPKHYDSNSYAPWRWIYKAKFTSPTSVASAGDNWNLSNSGPYTTTSHDIRSQAFRVNGDITGTCSVWSCPAAKDFVIEFKGSSGAFSSATKYTVSGLPSGYTHGDCATGYKYDTNKFLICSPNGVYNCTISGSSMAATNVTPSGVNNINLVGSAIFKLRDHYFFVRSTSGTYGKSDFGIYDVTNGFPGTSIYSNAPSSGTATISSNTSLWINFRKQNDNEMTIVVFSRYVCVAKYTLKATPICEKPSISPASWSNETNARNVTITSATSGSTIYYTTNGSDPTTSSAHISSGGTVTLNGNVTTLKAMAVKSGYDNSAIASAGSYTFKCATPTANISGGSYTSHQHITLSCTTSDATIRYTTNGSAPTSSSPVYSGTIDVTSTTRIRAKAFKNNYSDSNEFDQTYTINATLAAPTFSPATGEQFTTSGSVTITAPSGSTLHYSTDGGSSYTTASGNTATVNITEATTLKAYATQTDKTDSSIATASYTVKCATPTANINGGTYTTHQRITLSCATSGATIRYTTDGSEPTSSSAAYSSTITLTETTRLRAKAFKSNCVTSNEFDQTYTINATLDAPTFSVASGTQFTTSGSVTITAPSGSTLRYSTDGGSNYAAASGNTVTLTIYQTTTIKAYATQTNKTQSPIAEASYTVKCAAPTITPVTGTYPKEQSVNIACATPGATIYYTLDGSTPTTSSPVYYAPLTVNDGTNTNEYIPFYGWYADDYEKSEYIIPASQMSGLGASASSGVSLNSLTWYLSSPASKSFAPAQFKVFLKEVSGTSLGGTFSGPEGGTVVYEGALDATQATITVNFSTPYEYHGGNLLVGVYTTTTNGAYSHAYFYGTTGESDCSAYATNGSSLDNITEPNSTNFLPKTTFTYTPNHQPIIVSSTTTVKALAVMSGCVNSDVASETITITPQSQPVAPSSINVAYSPVIGTSTNNPDRDLARIDATITFNRPNTSDGTTFPAYPTTFSDYYLDHYIVTVFSGSGDDNYAKTESGADFRSISIDAKSGAGAANTVSLNARDLKINQQTEVCVTACYVYQPTSATAQSSQTTKSFSGYTYETYSPSISAKLFLFQNQEYKVWWESEHTSVTRYADVYRVEIQINDAMSTSAIPVSYYQLQMRRSPSAEWENIVDRTINNLCYGDSIEAHTTYPTGFGLAAGRFPGNYNFISHQYTADIGTEEEWDINLEYYYAFDVTPPAQSAPHQPLGHIRNYEGNEDPTKWQFRIVAVYGGSDSVTVDGTPVTPTTDNISESTEDVFIQHNDPIITGVDSVKGDVNLKEVQYYDLRGVRLNEAPSTGFYIEVRLYDNGQVVTSKRLAR